MMNLSPRAFRFLLNIYGPFLGAGVRVERISEDWKEIDVALRLRWYNRNAVGVQFGGSLYAMVDPHLMLMLMRLLGKDYVVWDKAAEIEFVAPGRTTVYSRVRLNDEQVEEIRVMAEDGAAVYPKFDLEIHDTEQNLVARVQKTLYVRKKRKAKN